MRKKVILLITLFLSFGIGANIYTDLRGYHDGAFKWVDILFPLNLQSVSGAWMDNPFVLYNLPDGLWMFSLCLLIILIWNNQSKSSMMIWLTIGLTLSFLLEILQRYGLILGTFDWIDILVFAIAFSLSLLFHYTLNLKPWKNGKYT